VTDVTRARSLVILGSTGSIGTQALDVLRAAPGRFEVEALCSGGRDLELLALQVVEFRPAAVGISRPGAGAQLRDRIEAIDVVLNGVAGDQGLRATLAALDAGRIVALANKESLIAGGSLVLDRAKPGQLVPVDSEHSALAQCLRSGTAGEVQKLIITASGGPFRGRTRADLATVTPAQAMAHPTWAMGPLITVNSATLVNKGLEVIEAHLLFDVPYHRIEAVVHPQSIVHSMVEFVDGSTIAQASPPDMRLPIALALGWPARIPGAARPVDWTTASSWDFEPLDHTTFPAVTLAMAAGSAGGCAPAVFNAANEELVAAFIDGRCSFLAITDTIEAVLERWLGTEQASMANPGTVEDIEHAQQWARARARALLGSV
jgi:1-deoxy-D-xylulose-5-phosphate reductoisomerase